MVVRVCTGVTVSLGCTTLRGSEEGPGVSVVIDAELIEGVVWASGIIDKEPSAGVVWDSGRFLEILTISKPGPSSRPSSGT